MNTHPKIISLPSVSTLLASIRASLSVSVWMIVTFAGMAFAQQDSLGTLIDVGTFTVRIPDVDDWSVNVDRENGAAVFSRTKQKLLSLFSSGAGGGTSMTVFRDRLVGGTPGLWVMNEQEMATYARTIELQSVAASAPGRAELTSARMDSAIVDGKIYYRLAYSEVLKNAFAVESILHLYFPPEFTRTKEFFGFLINESYVSGSVFASKDLEQIWPLIRSLQTAGPASTLPGVGGDLLRAAASGDSARVTHLVEGGANVNSLPRDGRGALALAALYGHESLARYLVDRGANINPDNISEFYSPLTSAILGREVRIAKFLLEKEAKANVLADSQWSPLIRAITMHLDTEFVATLLAHGADPNLGGHWTPLMHAANEGLPPVVSLLINRGAHLDLADSNGVTALAQALYRNQPEVAGILLTRGANPNATSKRGDSPLMLAAQRGDTVSLARLIQRGARVNASNTWGASALSAAADNGHTECARLLLSQGATVDQRMEKDDGRTPLYLAIQGRHIDCARLLLEKGADINASTPRGWTPLMAAAKRGDSVAVDLLISRGAQLDLENNEGDTALDIADDKDFDAIVVMLKEAASRN
jgi:uncharacterized protein